jgi:hypothetical protein
VNEADILKRIQDEERHPCRRAALLGAISVAIVLLIAAGGLPVSADPATSGPNVSSTLLSRKVIVALDAVAHFFPEITQEASAGPNATAAGKPTATRGVIYASTDGAKKVTISVDRYPSSSAASSAYGDAVEKSRSVPGFKPLAAPDLGERTFAGTVTQGAETHIGIGALDGDLVIGVTLGGYDTTPDILAKFVALARAERTGAKAASGDISP